MRSNFTKKDLRIFALILAMILAFFSIKFSKDQNITVGGIFLWASVTACTIGVFLPILILPVYKLFMFIGKIMSPLVTGLLLSIVFYCIFTPISIILKIRKRDILGLRIDKNKTSYWIERKDRVTNPVSMENQF